jgi:hypothetical protein
LRVGVAATEVAQERRKAQRPPQSLQRGKTQSCSGDPPMVSSARSAKTSISAVAISRRGRRTCIKQTERRIACNQAPAASASCN